MSNNKISNLPIELINLNNLEKLNLTGNLLDDLPLNKNNPFKNLRALWIAHNSLKNLTSRNLLAGIPNLKSVYCYSPKLNNPILCKDRGISSGATLKGNCIAELRTDYELLDSAERIWNAVKNLPSDSVSPVNHPTPQIKRLMKKIFISYAHKDSVFLERLKIHLKVLGRNVSFDVWDDTKIKSSEKWQEEIEKALSEATDAILLISTDFLASDFIHDNELPPLLEAAKLKGTRIHPVIIRPCQFLKVKSLSQFQAANSPEETVSECNPDKQERIWMKLCNDIQQFLEK